MKVILFRHGETEWNGMRRLQGQQDLALSEHGREQVKNASSLVRYLAPGTTVSSTLTRARESAAELGYPSPDVDSQLAERCLGEWEGRMASDILSSEGDNYPRWRAGTYDPPGSESIDVFRKRILQGLADAITLAVDQHEDTLLISTHGGVIRAIMDLTVGLGQGRAVPLHPASVSILDVDPTASALDQPGAVKLRLYNWTSEYIPGEGTE